MGAVTYLRHHHSEGRLFNTYNYGGFLTWALGRSWPVYVDGRTDLYDDAFLAEYIHTYMAEPGFERTLAKYHIGVVLVEPSALTTKKRGISRATGSQERKVQRRLSQ